MFNISAMSALAPPLDKAYALLALPGTKTMSVQEVVKAYRYNNHKTDSLPYWVVSRKRVLSHASCKGGGVRMEEFSQAFVQVRVKVRPR